MRVLVIIPTYNEVENIHTVLDRTHEAVPDAEILVVDDASPDGTADAVDERGRDDEHVLRRAGKLGLGTAYLEGFAWGMIRGFDALVEMDADLSHDPAALPSLLAEADAHGLVIGSRYVPGGSIPNWAWHRRALSRWGNRYAGLVLGLGVRDATAGFRVYRATTLDALNLDGIRADGYGFQVEMTYRVRDLGHDIAEVPIAFSDRTRGESKMSMRIVVEAMLLVTLWGVRDRLRLGRPRH